MTDDAASAEKAGSAAERLAEEIRTRRTDAGLSQARLAARMCHGFKLMGTAVLVRALGQSGDVDQIDVVVPSAA